MLTVGEISLNRKMVCMYGTSAAYIQNCVRIYFVETVRFTMTRHSDGAIGVLHKVFRFAYHQGAGQRFLRWRIEFAGGCKLVVHKQIIYTVL